MLKRSKSRSASAADAVPSPTDVVDPDVGAIGAIGEIGRVDADVGAEDQDSTSSSSRGAAELARAVSTTTATRRINLLPPEVVQERRDAAVRRRVLTSLGGLVVLLVAVWLFASIQGSSVRADLAAQKEANTRLERQIDADDLQEPVRKQQEVEERRNALATVLGQEVAFPRMLRELSRVMPPTMYLESVDLSVTVQEASSQPKNSSSTKKQPAISIDTFTQDLRLNARADGEMDLTADWLDRATLWPAVNRAWLNDQLKVETPSGGREISFRTSVELNGSILSERAQLLAKGELP